MNESDSGRPACAAALATPTASGMLLKRHRAHEVDLGLSQRVELDSVVPLGLVGRDRGALAIRIAARTDDADDQDLRDLSLKWPRNITKKLDRAQLKLSQSVA